MQKAARRTLLALRSVQLPPPQSVVSKQALPTGMVQLAAALGAVATLGLLFVLARRALFTRDALESEKDIVISHGVLNFTRTDHLGFDERGRVMLKIDKGQFRLVD